MKKIILALCVLILLVGCEKIDVSKLSDEDLDRLSDKLIVCDPPYIRHGSDCCLDQNENKICDKDEIIEPIPEEPEPLPEKCVISTGSGLFCDDYSASAGIVTLRIKNILTDTVTISGITLTVTGETCTGWSGSQDISADSTQDFSITCSTLASGDKVKGDISISFAKLGGLSKTATGQLVTAVS